MNDICAKCLNFKSDFLSDLMLGRCALSGDYIFGCASGCIKFMLGCNGENKKETENNRF